jgi:hypothetical protein
LRARTGDAGEHWNADNRFVFVRRPPKADKHV